MVYEDGIAVDDIAGILPHRDTIRVTAADGSAWLPRHQPDGETILREGWLWITT
jgi:hypothetical protein